MNKVYSMWPILKNGKQWTFITQRSKVQCNYKWNEKEGKILNDIKKIKIKQSIILWNSLFMWC